MNKGTARIREEVWKVKIRTVVSGEMTKGDAEGAQECDR
jgi:hypothetical protein